MTSLTTHFKAKTAKPQKLDMLKDSLTVMFADTRHGMDAKTKEAFSHLEERAKSDAHVAKYVAKIELSIGRHMPQAVTHGLHNM